MRIKEKLGSCCGTLKSYILTRRFTPRNGKDKGLVCEINCDLSDKRTFFAWQRNHMANERTFLAWCRTGISLIVFSFVIERFDLLIKELRLFSQHPELIHFSNKAHHMGIVTFCLGALIIVLAGWRFFYIRRLINQASTDFSPLPDLFLMGSVLVTVFMTFLFFVFIF